LLSLCGGNEEPYVGGNSCVCDIAIPRFSVLDFLAIRIFDGMEGVEKVSGRAIAVTGLKHYPPDSESKTSDSEAQ